MEQVRAMKAGESPRPPESLSPDLRKHSNVVRLFHTHKVAPRSGFYGHYIPGVGTPFDKISDTGGPLGSAAAAGGEARILWAFTRLLNSTHDYVRHDVLMTDDVAKSMVDRLSSFWSPHWQRRNELRYWQDKLKAALRGKKPEITQINLSVFGFSRGAAQARTFTNWLFEVCEQKDGGWLFAGIPIRLHFLGIFDTVASVGLADLSSNGIVEGHQGWADHTMEIHPAIEQCVHYVAGHEVRACFPLDSVRVRETYPPNAKEVMYPGAHSDVGGGYAPGALGISPSPNDFMSTIPAANMYREARMAGVPLMHLDELSKGDRADLTPSPEAISTFNSYVQAAAIGDGPVEEMHARHMGLYFSYRFKYRLNYQSRPWYVRASGKDRGYLEKTSKTILLRLAELRYPQSPADPTYDPQQALAYHEAVTKAAGIDNVDRHSVKFQQLRKVVESIETAKLSPPVERLFDDYVHDSMAGFIDMGMNEYLANGLGIMKLRKTFDKNG